MLFFLMLRKQYGSLNSMKLIPVCTMYKVKMYTKTLYEFEELKFLFKDKEDIFEKDGLLKDYDDIRLRCQYFILPYTYYKYNILHCQNISKILKLHYVLFQCQNDDIPCNTMMIVQHGHDAWQPGLASRKINKMFQN